MGKETPQTLEGVRLLRVDYRATKPVSLSGQADVTRSLNGVAHAKCCHRRRTSTFERRGDKAYRAEGELWREEWIEPADRSVKVRGDRASEEYFYSVGAAGERLPASALNNEDVGRYLWFRPSVIEALLEHRGSALQWYTRQTGQVRCSPDYRTHFGINRQGFVNVYAYDVAKLPQWQQRIWSGHNATPEGPVSSELLDSQMMTVCFIGMAIIMFGPRETGR